MAADQLIMDLTRRERSAEHIERALYALDVGPVQRAVLIQLCLDPRCWTDDRGLETLRISQAQAARWISQHVPCVGGHCHDTSVRKAWQYWADQGVLIVLADRNGHTIKWHPKRIMAWHQQRMQELDSALPLFAPIGGAPSLDDYMADCDPEQSAAIAGDCSRPVVTAGDCSRPVVTAGDCSRPVVTAGDSLRIEEEEEEISLPPPQSSEQATPRNDLPDVASEVSALLQQLPEPPDDVWNPKQPESALWTQLVSWWSEIDLTALCGDRLKEVTGTIAGLLLAARRANNPPAYYATCLRNGVRQHVTRQGRAWINQQQRQRQGVLR